MLYKEEGEEEEEAEDHGVPRDRCGPRLGGDAAEHILYLKIASEAFAVGEWPIWTNYLAGGSLFCTVNQILSHIQIDGPLMQAHRALMGPNFPLRNFIIIKLYV